MDTALVAHHADAEEEQCDDFTEIGQMTAQGIAATDIKKLKEAGFHTIKGLIMTTKKHLINIKGLSEAKVDKVVEAARKMDKSSGWMTGTEVQFQRSRDVLKISTGAQALDDILGGGMETKAITEIYGEYRTGKTQICLTLCVTCQLPTAMGGAEGKVAFIDTENTFRPERIRPIAERFNLDPDPVLNNIVIARAYTHEHQMDLLVSVAALMVEEPFKLLIMDSLMGNFRSEFIDPKKPIGGHVVAHASTTRISLRKGKAEQRLAKIVQSPFMPEAEASYTLAGDGIQDYKD